MAIELRNWVEGDLRVNLPAVELLKGPNITQLVDLLVGQLSGSDEAAPPKPVSEETPVVDGEDETHRRREAAELLRQVDEMSDERVGALLQEMEEEFEPPLEG